MQSAWTKASEHLVGAILHASGEVTLFAVQVGKYDEQSEWVCGAGLFVHALASHAVPAELTLQLVL